MIKEAKNIISISRNLFSPWFFLGNCYAILEDNIEAIQAYKEAIKYNSSQSNFSRLYHNLLVAYLSLNQQTEAIELVKKLEIGIKTNPFIIELIKRIEITNNIQLLSNDA